MERLTARLNRVLEAVAKSSPCVELPVLSVNPNGHMVVELRNTVQVIKSSDNLALVNQPHHPWITLNGMMFAWYGDSKYPIPDRLFKALKATIIQEA